MRTTQLMTRLILLGVSVYINIIVYNMVFGDIIDNINNATDYSRADEETAIAEAILLEEQSQPRDPWEDIPYRPGEGQNILRFDPAQSGHLNTVHGWPNVGGMIVASHVHSVELDFLGLNRFQAALRSVDQVEEDGFCRKLRKVGGKWWTDFGDWYDANVFKNRMLYPDERELLYLGWPEKGGMWVLRFDNTKAQNVSTGRVFNAFTMQERCLGIGLSGGRFYEKPEDCPFVRPLVEGFGEHEKRKMIGAHEGGWWDHGA